MDRYTELELLKMAKEIVETQVWSERDRLERDYNLKYELLMKQQLKRDMQLPQAPKLPYVQHSEVLRVAEALKVFFDAEDEGTLRARDPNTESHSTSYGTAELQKPVVSMSRYDEAGRPLEE